MRINIAWHCDATRQCGAMCYWLFWSRRDNRKLPGGSAARRFIDVSAAGGRGRGEHGASSVC